MLVDITKFCAELKEQIITPVVGSVIRPEELQTSEVFLIDDPDQEDNPAFSGMRQNREKRGRTRTPQIWIKVVAGVPAEELLWHLCDLGAKSTGPSDVEVAEFANRLETWVAESRFAWGQSRITRLPPQVS